MIAVCLRRGWTLGLGADLDDLRRRAEPRAAGRAPAALRARDARGAAAHARGRAHRRHARPHAARRRPRHRHPSSPRAGRRSSGLAASVRWRADASRREHGATDPRTPPSRPPRTSANPAIRGPPPVAGAQTAGPAPPGPAPPALPARPGPSRSASCATRSARDAIIPGDAAYEAGRTAPQHAPTTGGPAAIVRPADAPRGRPAPSSRRASSASTSRSAAAATAWPATRTTDGGLLIDLRAMRDVDIDPVRWTGTAQGGATAGEYTTAAATPRPRDPVRRHGLGGPRRPDAGRRHRLARPEARHDDRQPARGRPRDGRRRARARSARRPTPTCSGRSAAAAATSASPPASGTGSTPSTMVTGGVLFLPLSERGAARRWSTRRWRRPTS